MSTLISVLGGVGLSLLGMSVMTSGLKDLAGSGRTTLFRQADRAVIERKTMTTIGLLYISSARHKGG